MGKSTVQGIPGTPGREIDQHYAGVKNTGPGPGRSSEWSRLQLGVLLPERVERCIWVDTDTLTGRDLVELAETDLGANALDMSLNTGMTENIPEYLASNGNFFVAHRNGSGFIFRK